MIIQFGILNLKYLLIFCTPFIHVTRGFLRNNNENNNKFYAIFINFLSLTLCGIINLIYNFLTKSERNKLRKKTELISLNEKNLENKNSLKAQYLEYKKNYELKLKRKNKIKKMCDVLIISSLKMIAGLIKTIFKDNRNKQLEHSLLIILELVFLIIFSMLYLNYSLFRHQYASFLIFLLFHIIFLIQSIMYLNDMNKLTIISLFQSFLYYFLYEKLFCIYDIIGKNYLNSNLDNIYLFLFKIGITGLIPLLIYDLIGYICGLDDRFHGIIKTIINNFKIMDFICDLFFSIVFDISLWLTIYFFSPCHYIILDILKNFLKIIVKLIQHKENIYSKEQLITFYILYPVLIFDSLIFNEIIILNFLGLNKNTKLNIMKRGRLDSIDSENSFLNYNIEDDNKDKNLNDELDEEWY